jgi:hypothetical protein
MAVAGAAMISGVELDARVPDDLQVVTAAEQPELWAAVESDHRFAALWPEYNGHGNHVGRSFGALLPEYADVQVLVLERAGGEVIARGRTIPFRWGHDGRPVSERRLFGISGTRLQSCAMLG